jgi:hypothetical protein
LATQMLGVQLLVLVVLDRLIQLQAQQLVN